MIRALSTLLGEVAYGAAGDTAWILNPDDPGLLRSTSCRPPPRPSFRREGVDCGPRRSPSLWAGAAESLEPRRRSLHASRLRRKLAQGDGVRSRMGDAA